MEANRNATNLFLTPNVVLVILFLLVCDSCKSPADKQLLVKDKLVSQDLKHLVMEKMLSEDVSEGLVSGDILIELSSHAQRQGYRLCIEEIVYVDEGNERKVNMFKTTLAIVRGEGEGMHMIRFWPK